MPSCRVRDKSWRGGVPKHLCKDELRAPGTLPWRAGDSPARPAAEMLCHNGTVSGVFKGSVMFCLSFQVDLTSTSAAAAKAEAAVNLLIYRSQNTYKTDLACCSTVQRETMQPWEWR